MKKLYKFYWDCGRQGHVRGIFIAEEEKIKEAIGKQVYLGEILGKHSEVFGSLEEKDLTILTDDEDFIKRFEELKCSSGYSPLNYLNE